MRGNRPLFIHPEQKRLIAQCLLQLGHGPRTARRLRIVELLQDRETPFVSTALRATDVDQRRAVSLPPSRPCRNAIRAPHAVLPDPVREEPRAPACGLPARSSGSSPSSAWRSGDPYVAWKSCSVIASRALPIAVSVALMDAAMVFSAAENILSSADGLTLLPDLLRILRHEPHGGILVGKDVEPQPVGMHLARPFAECGRRHRSHEWAEIGLVKPSVDDRHALRRGELQVVFRAIAAELADVVESAPLQPEQVATLDQVAIGGLVRDILDDRLVKSGRHQIDHLHRARELVMLPRRDLAGDEDAEVPDSVVKRVDDGLAARDEVVIGLVQVGDPAERLLRRRDVVAPRAEDDDRRL